MSAEKNTPELWDRAWEREVTPEQDAYNRAREEAGVRWLRTERLVNERFGGFSGLRVIEIGAGAGTVAACMAARGAHVTILDYSPRALERSAEFFERAGISGDLVNADALALPADLLGRFDIAMSYGLAEHFTEPQRTTIVRAHLDVVRDGGLALVSVPNAANAPYRIYKVLAELAGMWGSGEEYPFSRREFEAMVPALDVAEHGFFGDSLAASWSWIDPVRIGRKLLKHPESFDTSRIKPEREGPLDELYAYALVLWAVKGSAAEPA
ncbi:MAG: class I SAM-dependent methyltransferase [Coriobacteriia bacterium]|nr:class I SAM-dependent methyltransferase [Coriobacteriia bacterium]